MSPAGVPSRQGDCIHVLAAYNHALAILREALDGGEISRRTGDQVVRPVFSVRS